MVTRITGVLSQTYSCYSDLYNDQSTYNVIGKARSALGENPLEGHQLDFNFYRWKKKEMLEKKLIKKETANNFVLVSVWLAWHHLDLAFSAWIRLFLLMCDSCHGDAKAKDLVVEYSACRKRWLNIKTRTSLNIFRISNITFQMKKKTSVGRFFAICTLVVH